MDWEDQRRNLTVIDVVYVEVSVSDIAAKVPELKTHSNYQFLLQVRDLEF